MAPVNEEVSQKKREEQQRPQLKREVSRILGIVLGCAIYAVGTNIFLRPMHLYSGGFMGYAQLITNLLRDRMNIHPGNLDLAGLIYYLMNLPFLILALQEFPAVVQSVLMIFIVSGCPSIQRLVASSTGIFTDEMFVSV